MDWSVTGTVHSIGLKCKPYHAYGERARRERKREIERESLKLIGIGDSLFQAKKIWDPLFRNETWDPLLTRDFELSLSLSLSLSRSPSPSLFDTPCVDMLQNGLVQTILCRIGHWLIRSIQQTLTTTTTRLALLVLSPLLVFIF